MEIFIPVPDEPKLKNRRRAGRVLRALSGIVMISGCATPPPASHEVQASEVAGSAVLSTQTQTLPEADLPPPVPPASGAAYRLGPDDVISVTVYMHPELSIPQPGETPPNGGVEITSDGSVSLPLIGDVEVGGLTIAQAENKINADFAATVNNPSVSIQLLQAQSLRYYLLGAFSAPGVKYPGRQMDLLDALALGGSVDISNADLYQAYVAEGSRKLPVDLHALLIDGDLTQNIALHGGDAIVIPPSTTENAFVFGAVGKPGSIPFQSGALSLLQALSVADLDLTNYSSAQLSDVRVIRSHGGSADFIVVDAAKILDGQALSFGLEPGDIVFVPPTNVASWNQVLSMLLPSLTTISGVLNPFVDIKFLSQKN
jgi:polysaccharide export outer membrane protein